MINLTTRTGSDWSSTSTQPAQLNRPNADDRPGNADAADMRIVIYRGATLVELKRDPTGTLGEVDTCDAINSLLYDIRNPHLSPNGLRLVFSASAANGAIGGLDLYVSTRSSVDVAWGSPARLPLSTENIDDTDPWMSEDGKRIWFNRGQTMLFSEYR